MNKQFFKLTALGVLISLATEIFAPLTLLALTGGPSQPEFSTFEPVSTTSMVNEFDGSFTYNLPVLHIPGSDGGEYAMSLSYHSGISPEEEASWVGYGWTLNPGSITRNKRGFPDDQKGAEATYWNKTRPNWTISTGVIKDIELFSYDKPEVLNVNNKRSASLRYNNYRGFGYTIASEAGVGYEAMKGLASLDLSVDDEKGFIFSGKINPASLLSGVRISNGKNITNAENEKTGIVFSDNPALSAISMSAGVISSFAMNSLTDQIRPTLLTPYSGISYNYAFNTQKNEAGVPIGEENGIFGNYNIQKNKPVQKISTYGYMYSGSAGERDMMDYHVEKSAPLFTTRLLSLHPF